ncbi:hypothetical protein BSL84_32420 [Streptomyces sp. TN58]|nr:hypothetical protein BSL84_32420 [Streptomyces sp. TN58]
MRLVTGAEQWQDDVPAGPGGVMTDEVGIVTGPLTVRTTVAGGGLVRFEVQYKDADEWYTLTGSPRPGHGAPAALHAAAVAAVRAGGGAVAPRTG